MRKKQLAERDEITLRYLPKIEKSVSYFIKRNPRAKYLQDDMVSEATFWVMHAATRHVTGHPIKKMDGYMHLCIMTGISLAIRDDKGIQKPRANTAKKVVGTRKLVNFVTGETLNSTPTPLLDACCADDTDLDILKMLFEGFNNPEIARRTRTTVTIVKRRRVEITKRLEAIESGEEDVGVSGGEDGA